MPIYKSPLEQAQALQNRILIEKPQGNDVFEILKNAGYDIIKDESKPILRYKVKQNDKDYYIDDYGYDGDSFFANLKW